MSNDVSVWASVSPEDSEYLQDLHSIINGRIGDVIQAVDHMARRYPHLAGLERLAMELQGALDACIPSDADMDWIDSLAKEAE